MLVKRLNRRHATSNFKVLFKSNEHLQGFLDSRPGYQRQIKDLLPDDTHSDDYRWKIVRFKYQKTLRAALDYFNGYVDDVIMDLRDRRCKNSPILEKVKMEQMADPMSPELASECIAFVMDPRMMIKLFSNVSYA